MGMGTVAVAALATLSSAWAGSVPQGRIVLRAEQDLGRGKLNQQAIIFDESTLTVTRDSNFFCKPGPVAWLGIFKGGYDARLRSARLQAEQVAARLTAPSVDSKGALKAESPLEVHLYIGRTEVTHERGAGGTIRSVLEEVCSVADLKPDDAVQLSLRRVKGRVLLDSKILAGVRAGRAATVPVAKACKALSGGIWECSVRGFGTAHLKL